MSPEMNLIAVVVVASVASFVAGVVIGILIPRQPKCQHQWKVEKFEHEALITKLAKEGYGSVKTSENGMKSSTDFIHQCTKCGEVMVKTVTRNG
jgi:hypothetical protein